MNRSSCADQQIVFKARNAAKLKMSVFYVSLDNENFGGINSVGKAMDSGNTEENLDSNFAYLDKKTEPLSKSSVNSNNICFFCEKTEKTGRETLSVYGIQAGRMCDFCSRVCECLLYDENTEKYGCPRCRLLKDFFPEKNCYGELHSDFCNKSVWESSMEMFCDSCERYVPGLWRTYPFKTTSEVCPSCLTEKEFSRVATTEMRAGKNTGLWCDFCNRISSRLHSMEIWNHVTKYICPRCDHMKAYDG